MFGFLHKNRVIWPRSHSLPSYYNGKGCKGLWDLSKDPEIPAARQPQAEGQANLYEGRLAV